MPIPAPTASFICIGIASRTRSRTLVTASTKKITPDRKVPDNATCHGIPIPSTTEYAKKALRPIPGASAIGYLAQIPMTSVPKTAATAVAVKTACMGMPFAPSAP